MGDNSDQLSQNPPVYIENSRNWNTPFSWYDGQQLDCNNTPYKYFAMAADQTLQLPYATFYHQEKPYLVNFRDQVTTVPKHRDTDASTFQDSRRLWVPVAIHQQLKACNM
jgi:hypothetical protein